MTSDKPKIVIIGGPTASGKSAVAMELAERFHGEIVSADSIQIYRHMDIGSAKPSLEDRARVPHHMIDIRDPDEDFSAGDFVREARKRISDILGRNAVPVVAGGTGLYIRLLVGGIVDAPPRDDELRACLRREEKKKGVGALWEKLFRMDPEAAGSIPRENVARIIRALEVAHITGEKPSVLRRAHGFKDRPYRALFLCLSPQRAILYERIDNRVDRMIRSGLLDEVLKLYRLGYSPELKSMKSLGYRHAGLVLNGAMALQDAVVLMKRDTRRYAKRQFTWFRSEPEALWYDPAQLEGIRLVVANFLGQ